MGNSRLAQQTQGGIDDSDGCSDVLAVFGNQRVLSTEMGTEQFVCSIEQVEIHDTDPKAESPEDPWDAVTSSFGELGDQLKSTYRKVADDRGPDEDEIKSAFATLSGAWDQVAESISDALRDPATRSKLKKAASSFATAVGSTLSDLGAEFAPENPTERNEEE